MSTKSFKLTSFISGITLTNSKICVPPISGSLIANKPSHANMSNNTEVKFCPSLPADHVLRSGAVVFPGVFDQLGSPLVIFPAETQNKLVSDVTKEEVAEFIYYNLCLQNKSRAECLVSVVADLREASAGVTRRVVELLLLLELHKRSVHSLYMVQPKKRDVQKLLHKLLSPSKRSSPAPFKCVFLKEVFELCNYVDRSQLPTNLGGYFIYSHENWVTFVKEMDSFVQDFVGVVRKLPKCIGALQDFSKLSIPADYESLSEFCSSNQVRLQQLRRDLGLDVLLKRCENMLEKFRHPEKDQCYQAMVGTVLFNHTALEMLHNYDRIRSAVEKVELLWRRVFSTAYHQLNILQVQRDAQQVVYQMEGVLQKIQSYRPEALRNSSRTEALRHEFNTSIQPHAMMLRCRAEAVLQNVSETAALPHRPEWIKDLEDWMERLRSAVEFQNGNINIVWKFHQCYRRIQSWFDMAVGERFLQDLLWSSCSNRLDESRLSDQHGDVLAAIEEFLTVHRPPDTEQLMQLAHLSNIISDTHLENAGKQLTHRCTSLQRLLASPGSASFRDLQLALQWQYEHLKSQNSSLLVHPKQNLVTADVLRSSGSFPHRVNENSLTKRAGTKNPLLLQLEKPPSLSSFDSGFDGAANGNLETGNEKRRRHESRSRSPRLQASEENVSSVSEHYVDGKSPRASIRIIPNVSVDSLNLEITVKRSTTLPKNPWLSLPVDDLENCYTVIISPSSPAQQRATPNCDRLTQTDRRSAETSTSVGEYQDHCADWSPIRNILSSTITDAGGGAEQIEAMPTLLWDSYDLRNLNTSSNSVLVGVERCEWDLKEEQELRAVEETLSRAAGILQEEESALAQEEILDVLLKSDHPDRVWPLWNHDGQLTQMSYSELSEAGVIGLEDLVSSLDFTSNHDDTASPGLILKSPPSSEQVHVESGTLGPDRIELLKELNNLHALEEMIIKENLKLHELRHCEPEEKSSSQGLSEDRRKFLVELEWEKKEVEQMEKNFRLETKKSKQKSQSRDPKVVKCSVMGRASALRRFDDDEALLMNCRRTTLLEEPSNQESLDLATDGSFNSEHSNPEALDIVKSTNNIINTNLLTQDQQIVECIVSSSKATSAMENEYGLDLKKNKMDCSVSAVVDISKDFTSAVEEPSKPSDDPSDLEIKPEIKVCDPQEGPLESMDTIDLVQSENSDEASAPAFDPGGPKPLPRPSKVITGTISKVTAQESISEEPPDISVHPLATFIVPKPKECKTPPSSRSNEHQHQNNNNNNLHSDSVGSESIYGAADQIHLDFIKPDMNPESPSPVCLSHLLEMSRNKAADLQEESEIDRAVDQMLFEHSNIKMDNKNLISRPQSHQLTTLNIQAEDLLEEYVKAEPINRDDQILEQKTEAEVSPLYDDCAVRRSACRSPVHQELQTYTRQMSDFQTPLVLDTGSGLVKAGFANQDLPTTIFPTAIGLPKYEEVMSSSLDRSVYVGHDAQHMRGVLTLHWPMKNGAVRNWEQIEMIWQHAFDQLRVCSEDHPVLITEGVMSAKENQQRSIQIIFESFNVPLTYTALQPVLALYTTGRTTGVVFDSGDGVSHSVPVYDGYSLPHAVQCFNLAGSDVTLHLKQLLQEQGVCMRTSAEMEIVRDVKERCCVVALDYEAELKGGGGASTQVHYTLPDGQVVSLTTERFRAPEILFKPELIGQDFYGMHESIFKSVLQSDIDLRRDLVGNIVLSGGNTLLAGLPERLRREISRLAPADLGQRVKVVSPDDRDFSVWRGGAVLASMPAFSSAWITRDEYEEFGPQIVFRKCF